MMSMKKRLLRGLGALQDRGRALRRRLPLGKKRALAAACLLCAGAVLCLVCSPRVVGAAAAVRRLPVYCVARDDRACALSFDAAWGNEDTRTLIDVLGRYGVKATFFVVGQWVDKYPESVRALAEAGHEVMNHSDDHAHFTKLSEAEIAENVNACSDKLEAVTGVRPTLFRAPYGEYDDRVIAAVEGLGLQTVQWDVDSLDWKELSAAEITERVLKRVSPGSIVLFHNAAKHTPEALPGVIEALIRDGYTILPVSELLLRGETTIDHEGRQRPAN
jgi:polysaccharide deacetylase family sporulation protein PdaB